MNILDNVNNTLREDLFATIKRDSKVSIAAACFSIYAYQALKEELEGIEELRFIFTSPTFGSLIFFPVILILPFTRFVV